MLYVRHYVTLYTHIVFMKTWQKRLNSDDDKYTDMRYAYIVVCHLLCTLNHVRLLHVHNMYKYSNDGLNFFDLLTLFSRYHWNVRSMDTSNDGSVYKSNSNALSEWALQSAFIFSAVRYMLYVLLFCCFIWLNVLIAHRKFRA